MDEGYDTWIGNLMNGTVSAEEQAMRARFRAMQAATSKPATRVSRPVAVETAGRNIWAVSTEDGDDALTTFTLLAGPGVPDLIAGR